MSGAMGGKMGGGGGSGGSPFDQAALGGAFQESAQAVHNRYKQLGIGIPAAGGPSAAQAAAGGTSLAGLDMGATPSTMEQMDLSMIPSESGGLGLLLEANKGQLQNEQMNNPVFQPAAQAQRAFSQGSQQAENAGFQAGAGGNPFAPGGSQ
jgi:hypothetical protein